MGFYYLINLLLCIFSPNNTFTQSGVLVDSFAYYEYTKIAFLFLQSTSSYLVIACLLLMVLIVVLFLFDRKMYNQLKAEKTLAEEQIQIQIAEIQKFIQKQEKLEKLNLLINTRLNHKIELIQNISSNLESGNASKASTILKNNVQVERKFSDTKRVIENVNNVFYNQLIEMAKEELTAIDLKYCTYIHLNYDSAEMSTIFNVTRKSVRMAKYRIKKKLGLEADVDLSVFLRNLKH